MNKYIHTQIYVYESGIKAYDLEFDQEIERKTKELFLLIFNVYLLTILNVIYLLN